VSRYETSHLGRLEHGNERQDIDCADGLVEVDWPSVVRIPIGAGDILSVTAARPGAIGVSDHIAVKGTSPVMRDDKEIVEYAKGHRRHGEEIHRGYGFPMIAQKSDPSLCRFRTPRRFPHPAQNGSFRDIEAQASSTRRGHAERPRLDSRQLCERQIRAIPC
jgi:hypothetical protein